MTDTLNQTLVSSYRLIQEGELSTARMNLQPLLSDEPDNPNVWWLYLHSVEDTESGIRALNRLLEIDPAYPGISNVIQAVKQKAPNMPIKLPLPQFSSSADAPPLLPEKLPEDQPVPLSSLVDKAKQSEAEESQGPSWLLLLAGVVIVLLLAIGLIAALNNQGQGDNVNDEQVDDVVLPPSDTTDVAAIQGLMIDMPLRDEGVYLASTTLGETLLVATCSPIGPGTNTVISGVMQTLVRDIEQIGDDIAGIGIDVQDCENQSRPILVGVSKIDAQEFANGNITEADFQRLWQPIDQVSQ